MASWRWKLLSDVAAKTAPQPLTKPRKLNQTFNRLELSLIIGLLDDLSGVMVARGNVKRLSRIYRPHQAFIQPQSPLKEEPSTKA